MIEVAVVHNHPIHYKHLLFCELAKRMLDFEVLFTGGSSGQRIEAPLPRNQEYRYRIGWDGPYEDAAPAHTARFVWRSLSELRPRVVIISGYYDVAAWTAWLWAERHHAQKILWAESNEFDHQRRTWREMPKKLFVSRCDLAHVYGKSNKAYIRRLGMPEDKIFVKRAVADTARFLEMKGPKAPKHKHKVLLYVGRLSHEKNLSCLLRAFRRIEQSLENPCILLHIVGYGPQESELRQLTEQLAISSVVSFRGKFRQAELPEVYGNADAFILPSLVEPWGLVVNEAMLCGLPVLVSTKCGCALDLVQPETGWTFSPSDETALHQLLEEVARTPRETLETMGRAAREIAAQYSPQNCAEIVANTVRHLLRNQTCDPTVLGTNTPKYVK